MEYKMYLLDIRGLEDKSLAEEALALIDDRRREIVDKYCREKDRLRAIAAGLLLQMGFLELEPEEARCGLLAVSGNEFHVSGMCSNLETEQVVKCLQKTGAVKILYQNTEHGKPYWDREILEDSYAYKKLWHFNLSHSGDYVALAVADTEVGIDIQEPRENVRFPGGIHGFSRMESYVKCTGEGFAGGYATYKSHHGNVPGYVMQSMDIIEQYALTLCFAVEGLTDNMKE